MLIFIDLRPTTQGLIHELQDQQRDIFQEEDIRLQTVGNLEKLHKELTGEHVQDLITGFELSRKDQDILIDYDVRKAAFGEQKDVLKSRIDDVQLAHKQIQEFHCQREDINKKAVSESEKKEHIEAQGLCQESQELRKDNNNIRNNVSSTNSILITEKNNTNSLKEKHDNTIKAYNDTIDKFNNLLLKVEQARKEAASERVSVLRDISKEDFLSTVISNKKKYTDQTTSSLIESVNRLKKQFKNLESKYNIFLDGLTHDIQQQEKESEELQDLLRKNGDSMHELSNELKTQSQNIEDLHQEIDKENAVNLNTKVSKLIDELMLVDEKRRSAQDSLESAQRNWSMKLALFSNEASRRSREAAREKRIHEIEKQISKIDQNSREIYGLQTEIDTIEAKFLTDTHRDIIDQELRRELDGIKLKVRWAEDERRLSFEELQKLLQTLKECDIREMQETEIRELFTQIEETKTLLKQRSQEIKELETEISICNTKIEEILRLIQLKNQEIEELNEILQERNILIKNLKKQLGKTEKSGYAAARGDQVDQMLADFLNMFGTKVPILRLGGGFYLFGTRKIYAKIMNGRLVVRVGGGYMTIDEFVSSYEMSELKKLEKLAVREEVDSIYDLDLEAITGIYASDEGRSPGNRSPTGRSPLGKTSPGRSPKNRSFKTAAMNGSQRSPKVTTAALRNAKRV